MNEMSRLLILSSEDVDTAEFLYKNNLYRPCVSRAYYAMYYIAQALLLSEGIETSTHRGVIKLINLHFVKTGRLAPDISKLLGDTHDLRQSGDYETDFVANQEVADQAIADAKTFIAEVRKILAI
ncbi:HEPN domain-containing protein [Pseudanabaena sp. FACHB-1277]|uniref:HEPN domain-containing protein n=1 Tax=Pseudanabaena cinerea FACHB-1277 TaxID=2949581 RepID=A0A926UQP9_9CYAN|nr:HEPN domain-containing protein [Pseudanabaena cinerea]MBD2149475.1 HEPN domain-containing protein [Pseudanabaena cinerea FACHB-1277]